MAVTHGSVYVAPSVDIKTKAELDSISIDSGIYYSLDEISIVSALNVSGDAFTHKSSKWTVLCMSTQDATKVKCYTQIWIDSSSTPVQIFIRTLNANETAYNRFTKLSTADSLRNAEAVINKVGSIPVELYAQSSSPGTKSGVTRIWIDTSN